LREKAGKCCKRSSNPGATDWNAGLNAAVFDCLLLAGGVLQRAQGRGSPTHDSSWGIIRNAPAVEAIEKRSSFPTKAGSANVNGKGRAAPAAHADHQSRFASGLLFR